MIFLFLNEQKKKKSYRHTSKEGDTQQCFCTKKTKENCFLKHRIQNHSAKIKDSKVVTKVGWLSFLTNKFGS